MSEIKAQVVRLRTKMSLTQRQLALRVGVDQRTISHIEKGIRKPSLALTVRLARELGVSTDVLLGVTETEAA